MVVVSKTETTTQHRLVVAKNATITCSAGENQEISIEREKRREPLFSCKNYDKIEQTRYKIFY